MAPSAVIARAWPDHSQMCCDTGKMQGVTDHLLTCRTTILRDGSAHEAVRSQARRPSPGGFVAWPPVVAMVASTNPRPGPSMFTLDSGDLRGPKGPPPDRVK